MDEPKEIQGDLSNILKTECETFESLRHELVATDLGRYALIKETDLLGVYDTQMDAINDGLRRLGITPFLTKRIMEIDVPEIWIYNLSASAA